jgi:hypothetical protein
MCRLDYNIKMGHKEKRVSLYWIHLRNMGCYWVLMSMVENFQVSTSTWNFLNSRGALNFQRGTLLHGVYLFVCLLIS